MPEPDEIGDGVEASALYSELPAVPNRYGVNSDFNPICGGDPFDQRCHEDMGWRDDCRAYLDAEVVRHTAWLLDRIESTVPVVGAPDPKAFLTLTTERRL
jgi:hypothetical protein